MSRRDQALRPPDTSAHDFTKFPRKTHRAGTAWFRQHNDRPADADRGAWYFASHAPGVVGEGRFDLTDPDGSCYLATTKRGAANECIGPEYFERGWVDADLVAGRVLSELPLPHDVKAANMTSERAGGFRVTNEVHSTGDYATTQAWAQAVYDARYGGVHYELRFSTGAPRGLALFGPAGPPDPKLAGAPDPEDLRAYLEGEGIEIVDPPSAAAVTIVTP